MQSTSGGTGPLLLGVIISSFIFGITFLQTWSYFRHFKSDGRMLKGMVLAILVLDALTVAFDTHTAFFYFVSSTGNPSVASQTTWSFAAQGMATGTLIFVAQSFLIIRLWKLRIQIYPTSALTLPMTVFFSILAVFPITTSYAMSIISLTQTTWSSNNLAIKPLLLSNLSVETGLDVSLTVALLHILGVHQYYIPTRTRRDGFILPLILFFSTRGIMMTVFQLATIISFAADSESLVWAAMSILASKVYALSVLVILNNRESSSHPRERRTSLQGDTDIAIPVPPAPSPLIPIAARTGLTFSREAPNTTIALSVKECSSA